MSVDIVTKSAVSVTEMARMVGLSRARFYQLVRKGTFPNASQDPLSSRPCYLEDQQRLILDARRRNCGVDGKPILFYSRRSDAGQKKTAIRQPSKGAKAVAEKYTDLIDGLATLNVTTSAAQIEPILKELFPQGTEGVDPGVIIRTVFLRIRRQDSSDSVG